GVPPVALRRIPPIMFGDELFQAACGGKKGRAGCCGAHRAPFTPEFPFILGGREFGSRNCVTHRTREIFFAVRPACHLRDRPARHHFLYEYHASPYFTTFATPDVKTQIYFIKIHVEGDRHDAENPGAQKLETDNADVRAPSEGIELGPAR